MELNILPLLLRFSVIWNIYGQVVKGFFLINGQNVADDLETIRLVYETSIEALPFTSDYNHGLNILHCSICTLNSRSSTECQQFCINFLKIQRIIEHTPSGIDSTNCENCFATKKLKQINSCAEFCSIKHLGHILSHILFTVTRKEMMKSRFESKVFVYDPALVDTSQIDLDLIMNKPKINNVDEVDDITAEDEIKLPIKNSIFNTRKFTEKGNTMQGYDQQPLGEFIELADSEEYRRELAAFLELFALSELQEERAWQAKKQHQRQPKNSYKWSKSDHCRYCRSIKGLPLSCDRVCVVYGKRD